MWLPEPHMGSRGFPVHGVKDFRRGECRATSMRETGLEPHYRHMASQISGVKHKEFGQIDRNRLNILGVSFPGGGLRRTVPRIPGQLCHKKNLRTTAAGGMKGPRSHPRPISFTPTPPPTISPAFASASEASPPEHEGYPPAPSVSSAYSAWWLRWPNGPSTP